MHILNQVQVNLIYNTNRNIFLWIEISISTMDLYNTTADRWSCHLTNRNKQRTCFQWGSVLLRSDIKGTELRPANILIPPERQLIAPHCKRCILATAIPSVRLSVRHIPVLCQNDGTQHDAVCTVRQQNVSSFVETKKYSTGTTTSSLKSWLQVTYPLLKATSFDTFCLVAPQLQEIEMEVQSHLT